MPKRLILQFRVEGNGNTPDLDWLIGVEDRLDAAIRRNRSGYVDGHDIGSGQMNLFIVIETWKHGVWFMRQYLKHQPWASEAVLAKRIGGNGYEVLWPAGYQGTFDVI